MEVELRGGSFGVLENMFHRMRPNTVPWKTMWEIVNGVEAVPFTSTVAVRGER